MPGALLSAELLTVAVQDSIPLAQSLLEEVRSLTADGAGVSREPYGRGEQLALDALARTAALLGVEQRIDPFGNLYITLPGMDRAAPAWLVGSHVDSVPAGGNYDGLAGVVAGVTALAAFRRAGVFPPWDITVMAIRGEELSAWYGGKHDGHIGSRAALGLLPAAELDSAVNSRSGRTLRGHIQDAGADPAAVGRGAPYLAPEKFRGYLELHIEQGPVLQARGIPVGVVSAIRGAVRGRSCRCLGAYTHSGAVPHELRSDAVMAAVELVHELDAEWSRVRAAGGDLVVTVGKFFTDSRQHALTKVPGEVEFSLDFRSGDEPTLASIRTFTERLAAEIGRRRRVRFEFAPFSLLRPAAMDPAIRERLLAGSCDLGIAALEMPSGAGHDAQDFAHAGFRAGMIFVRNSHGSHNPEEAMDIADFTLGTRLLAWMLATS
ncbi:MAG TPA: hydantoinase/carbamoylase family amidase [Burkholderiales bacterium]|nr:hydantoinase/carbamoylase family amidase [Burkholderiales bacterium]